jgi:fatty acid desaturase
MRLDMMQQLSVLACATGFWLAAMWFAGLWIGADTPDWMPLMIAGIGGFELFSFGRERARRRSGGKRG